MSTSHLGGGAPGALDRLTDWVLDHDGDIYGRDERERLRWYEAIALAASAQWILVPWTFAVLVWFADRGAAILLAIALAVFYLTIPIANVHVARKRVAVEPLRWSRKRIGLTVVSFLPYPVFIVGLMSAVGDAGAPEFTGALVGGIVGLAVGVVAITVRGRRRARRLEQPTDGDID